MTGQERWRTQILNLLQDSNRAELIALRATNSRAIAEEAVQETLARLLQREPLDLNQEQLTVYFFKMVRGVAMDMMRSSRRQRARELTVSHGQAASVEDIQVAREAVGLAKHCLARLPDEEREIVSLCCEQGLTQKLAAEILGMPTQTAFRRFKVGLQKLHDSMAAHGHSSLPAAALTESLYAGHSRNEWTTLRFDALSMNDWDIESGEWAIVDGEFVSRKLENTLISTIDVPGTFSITAEGWVDGIGELSLIGHRPSKDFKNYSTEAGYYFQFGAEFNSCTKFARGASDVLIKHGLKLEPRKRYTLQLDYNDEDGLVVCCVDGRRIFAYRELSSFPGNRVGFYTWGAPAHLRPIQIRYQDWSLHVPPLRAADRLFQYGHFNEALACYEKLAADGTVTQMALEAELKAGICKSLLHDHDGAVKTFQSLAGTPLEPYALAEESICELRRQPRKGVALLQRLLAEFPTSQAKARIIDTAHEHRRLKELYGTSRTEDFQLRAEIQRLSAATIDPPAGSQIKCALQQVRFLLRLAEWDRALTEIQAIKDKTQPGQTRVFQFASVYIACALAAGRDDLLPASVFDLYDWFPADWMDWAIVPIADCVIRQQRQTEFLRGYNAAERKPFSSTFNSHLLALHVSLSQGVEASVENDLLRMAGELVLPVVYRPDSQRLGLSFVHCRNAEKFHAWCDITSKPAELSASRKYRDAVWSLKARWWVEAGGFDRAAGILENQPAPQIDSPFAESLVLQCLLSSLGCLKLPDKQTLAHAARETLSGTELDLAEVFLGKRGYETVRWPAGAWRAEWRLWTALWLREKGDKTAALRVLRPARDKRYGLTNCQPAVERWIAAP